MTHKVWCQYGKLLQNQLSIMPSYLLMRYSRMVWSIKKQKTSCQHGLKIIRDDLGEKKSLGGV